MGSLGSVASLVGLGLLQLMAWIAISCAIPAWGSTTVEVTGEGSSRYAAQMNAVRNALQAVVKQIVVADREVRNDQLVLDRITSSANGYVESFVALREERLDSNYRIQARVTVSESPIVDYLQHSGDNSSKVSGDSIAVEVTRERENREFRTRLLSRALQGYPHSAVQVRSKGVRPDPNTPEILYVDVEYTLRPEFVEAFRSTAQSVSCGRDATPETCPTVLCFTKSRGIPSQAPRMWPDRGFLGMGGADYCYRVPRGSGPSRVGLPGGYPVFDRFIRPAMQYDWPGNVNDDVTGLALVTLLMGSDGARIPGRAGKCLDRSYPVEPLIFADAVSSTAQYVQVLWIGEYPLNVRLQLDMSKDTENLRRLGGLEFVPTFSVGRKLYGEVLSSQSDATTRSMVAAAFRPELGIQGCFN